MNETLLVLSANWLAGEADERDERHLAELLRDDPEAQVWFREQVLMHRLLHLSIARPDERAPVATGPGGSRPRMHRRRSARHPRPLRRRRLAAALVATAVIAMGAVWYLAGRGGDAGATWRYPILVSNDGGIRRLGPGEPWSSPAGGEARIEAPGLRIAVSGSASGTWVGGSPGELALDAGRIDVALDPDQGRRFVASTAQARIAVLGTRFAVDARDARTAVAVTHGRVSVSALDESVELVAGQHAIVFQDRAPRRIPTGMVVLDAEAWSAVDGDWRLVPAAAGAPVPVVWDTGPRAASGAVAASVALPAGRHRIWALVRADVSADDEQPWIHDGIKVSVDGGALAEQAIDPDTKRQGWINGAAGFDGWVWISGSADWVFYPEHERTAHIDPPFTLTLGRPRTIHVRIEGNEGPLRFGALVVVPDDGPPPGWGAAVARP